jgi:hypothetical protein
MNDFYEQKAKKYKYKYLKLKSEYIGEGGSGILDLVDPSRVVNREAQKEKEKEIFVGSLTDDQKAAWDLLNNERDKDIEYSKKYYKYPSTIRYSPSDFIIAGYPTLTSIIEKKENKAREIDAMTEKWRLERNAVIDAVYSKAKEERERETREYYANIQQRGREYETAAIANRNS